MSENIKAVTCQYYESCKLASFLCSASYVQRAINEGVLKAEDLPCGGEFRNNRRPSDTILVVFNEKPELAQ